MAGGTAIRVASQSVPKPWHDNAWIPMTVEFSGNLGAAVALCDELQDGFAGLDEQQEFRSLEAHCLPIATLDGSISTSTSKYSGGRTPCLRAQFSRSAGVWQQQLFQHCSAFRQPHALSMHGNGIAKSFGTKSENGNGKPPATKRYMPAASHPQIGKLQDRKVRRKRRNIVRKAKANERLPVPQYNRRRPQRPSAGQPNPYELLHDPKEWALLRSTQNLNGLLDQHSHCVKLSGCQ
jgi:hypothetical protein